MLDWGQGGYRPYALCTVVAIGYRPYALCTVVAIGYRPYALCTVVAIGKKAQNFSKSQYNSKIH